MTRPAIASICKPCVWGTACTKTLRDLAVANLERFFQPGGNKTTFLGIGPDMLREFQRRAALLQGKDPQPYLRQPGKVSSGDYELFLDVETDPLRDCCYLHGVVIRGGAQGGRAHFEALWMETLSPMSEREAFAAFWALIEARPESVVYVYLSYEKNQYRKLAARYPDVCAVEAVEALFGNGGRATATPTAPVRIGSGRSGRRSAARSGSASRVIQREVQRDVVRFFV